MPGPSTCTRRRGGALFAALLASGCSVTLLSAYDERTDQLASEMQRKMTGHFETLAGASMPSCLYGSHQDFYREMRTDLAALDLRTRSIPKNEPTMQMVGLLGQSISGVEKLHQIDSAKPECLTTAELAPLRQGIDQHFGAIMRLELAKKRGED